MQVNSVWHLTLSSRSLRINKSGDEKNAAIVFTKSMDHGTVKESTRIAMQETAKKLKLRKYLILGDDSTVSAGPFNISVIEVSEDGNECNILINEKYYFLTFVPDNFYAVPDDVILLIPAESGPEANALRRLNNLFKTRRVEKALVSGEFASKWCEKIKKCEVVDNIYQQGLF